MIGLIACIASCTIASPLSLPQVQNLAIEHSDEVRIAQSAAESSRSVIDQLASLDRPYVAASAKATRFDDKTIVSFAGKPMELLPDHDEQLSLFISQNIDLCGLNAASRTQARLGYAASAYLLQARRTDAVLESTVAFYRVLCSQKNVEVGEASLSACQAQLKNAKALYSNGVGLKLDVLRAASQVEDAEQECVKRRNELNMARSSLNNLIGQPLDSDLVLSELDATSVNDNAQEERSRLVDRACSRRPEVLAAQLAYEAAKKGVKVAQASSLPEATLSVGGVYYPTTSFISPRETVGTLSLSLQLPIFDGGYAKAKKAEARSHVDSAQSQLDQLKRLIALDTQNAALNMESARKRLVSARASAESAKAAYELAKQRYETQVGVYLEVTDTRAALTAAQSAEVNAHYDLKIAEAQLLRATADLTIKEQK